MKETLTLRQKIGQMLVFGWPSTEITPEVTELIEDYKISNVILFSHNIENAAQLRNLCAQLQGRISSNSGYPAFICIDQEGGMVARLTKDFTAIPGAMAISATQNPRNAYLCGKLTAEELRETGVNFDLAPVMDINSNENNPVIGVRAYGDTADNTTPYALAMMKGLIEGGVMPAVKHFPGHGDTAVDSHLGLPTINKTLDELLTNELVPFQAAIAAGVPCIMSTHILFPLIEKERLPATMSHTILTGLLKEQLGFKGLIITDCLEMDAIKEYYGTAQGALAAIKAGAELLCISHTPALVRETVEFIEAAVQNGTLNEELIDRAVEKVLQYKQTYAREAEQGNTNLVGCPEHRAFVEQLSLETITMVPNGAPLPSIGADTLFAGCRAYRFTLASSVVDTGFSFPAYMANKLGGGQLITPINPDNGEIDEILRQAKEYKTVVLGTYNAHLNRGQIDLANALCKAAQNVVVVALRNPYDLPLINKAACRLATYEYTPLAFDSLAKILRGEAQASGSFNISLKF